MTIARARIVKGAFAPPHDTRAPSAVTTRPNLPIGHRIAADVLAAKEEAERIVVEAHARAEAILAAARGEAEGIAGDAARQAREEETARLAASFLALEARAADRANRDLDRTIEIALVLAERLVGEALRVDPSRVAELAATALAETRGARRIRIEASPDDLAALGQALAEVARDAVFEPNAELSRGSLVVHTDLGTIDARLSPQLARLARALREALQSER